MLNKLQVAISGKSGCGNTSVSQILAEHLKLEFINYTFHDMAVEKGITFAELMKLADKDPQYDLSLDQRQVTLASGGGCVLGSRLAIWLLKEAHLKVYLEAPLKVRAGRIAFREQKDFNIALKETTERDKRDHKRFLKLYSINNEYYDFADLIIDTVKGDQYYVADIIENYIKSHVRLK